jgi:hypothetical protein
VQGPERAAVSGATPDKSPGQQDEDRGVRLRVVSDLDSGVTREAAVRAMASFLVKLWLRDRDDPGDRLAGGVCHDTE